MALKFYKAENGSVFAFPLVESAPAGLTEMVANTTDAATEKHVPVIEASGNLVKVTVGSVAHPMLEAHSIQWIALETAEGVQKKALRPGDAPEALFALTDTDRPVAAYEYCNLHGLWKAEI